jgi:hypothetical protein
MGHRTCRYWREWSRFPSLLPGRWPIRTLGVSLVAIAAIVVSLTVARQRSEQRQPEPKLGLDEPPAAVDFDLDDIRAAGL